MRIDLHSYLLCLSKNQDIAEELTQETFYKMIKKIHTFKGESKISVWLCEIAKNLWYDSLRKKKYKTISYDEISNSDLRLVLENFLNGGTTTEFGTVMPV